MEEREEWKDVRTKIFCDGVGGARTHLREKEIEIECWRGTFGSGLRGRGGRRGRLGGFLVEFRGFLLSLFTFSCYCREERSGSLRGGRRRS